MAVPHEISQYQLKKVSVLLLSVKPLKLKCYKCEAIWTVTARGLRLPKGYWKCPNGCNTAKER